jgi:predicted phage terminase large subunit-like protein
VEKRKEKGGKRKNKMKNTDFETFAAAMVPSLEITPFHRAYYRVLEAFACGEIRRLIVTVPPQHGKSLGSSVLLPAYMLGLNPDLRVAIASYSASLAGRFNKRVQRIIDSEAYLELFPMTTIKGTNAKGTDWVRTSDRVEVIGRQGELMSVGRDGSLTGNRIDIFVIDDLYKNAMEANSPTVRESCWEWYTSVVRTRQHNGSSELIVFTRWHEEDLIGSILAREKVVPLREWGQLDSTPAQEWLLLNFEALKDSAPTEIDPRAMGEALWPERHNEALLAEKRRLDAHRFEAMYQGRPSNADTLLYGEAFNTYAELPADIVRWANYTDTADTGEDFLCSVCYGVDGAGAIYVMDVVYSQERMEVTEKLVADMVAANPLCEVLIESNNGGRGFARNISRLAPANPVKWFHQSATKEARILSNSSSVLHNISMPVGWRTRWPEFYTHLATYQRRFRSNRWHDGPDVLTGIVERELTPALTRKIRALTFSR